MNFNPSFYMRLTMEMGFIAVCMLIFAAIIALRMVQFMWLEAESSMFSGSDFFG